MRFSPSLVGTGLLLGLLLLGAGCSSKSSPSTAGYGSQNQTGGVTIPPNFPPDMPLYPGGKVLSALGSGDNATLAQSTKAKTADVVTWINQQLANQGAVLETQATQGNSQTFVFLKSTVRFHVRIDTARDVDEAYLTITKEPAA